jgi:hypothetical protein
MWQPEDTQHLAVMFVRSSTKGWTPCRINRKLGNPPKNVHLHCLATFLDLGEVAGTTRVVRLNRLTGTRVELLGRIDWDAIPPEQEEGLRVWVTPSNAGRLETTGATHLGSETAADSTHSPEQPPKERSQGRPRKGGQSRHGDATSAEVGLPPQVAQIVVKDMRKGVVSKALVERLVQLYPSAEWFVS